VSNDEAALAAARSLIAQYGEDAATIAVMRAAEYAALGDLSGLAAWDAVTAAIEALQAGPGPAGAH
jgi:hypothetical protein